jgi:hypothetical protein
VLRPVPTGVETFELIRQADAPETYAYHLELGAGQQLSEEAGVARVTEAGHEILRITAPVALDADHLPVPIALDVDGDTVTVTVRHRGAGVRYPVLADPDWESNYDWSHQAGVGTEGWFVQPTTNPAYYNTDILTDPVAPDGRDPTGANANVGLRIAPKNGQLFPVGVGGDMAWQAPGTTRIASVDFRDVVEVNDRDRQTSRLRLVGGSEPIAPTDDWFTADSAGRHVARISLVSANADATLIRASMFTPPCTPEEIDAHNCPRFVPADHGSILKLGSVDIALVDNDSPSSHATGQLPDLAGQWIKGQTPADGTQPLTADLFFDDLGSGVAAFDLSSTDAAGTHEILPSEALCDENHVTTGAGSNICPAHIERRGFTIDANGLPEGENRFELSDVDFAGNPSDQAATGARWSVYLDRTRPTISASGPLFDASNSWTDPALVTPRVHLHAHDDRSGIQHTDLSATDDSGAQVLDTSSDACTPQGAPGQPCPNDYGTDIDLDADSLPEGPLQLTASSTDHVGLQSDPAHWTLHLDRTPPIARAHGDLVALQDRWTNTAGQVAVALDGRDRLSGVDRLELLAVNDEGRRVLGSVPTCPDRDPTDGSCPHLTSATLNLDAAALPDGRSHFEVRAQDLAGHTSRAGDSWDTYVDHTPPPIPTGIRVTANSPTSAEIHWNPVIDVPEGAQGVSYAYIVLNAGVPVTRWTDTPYPKAVIPGLSPGVRYTILIVSKDKAGNMSSAAQLRSAAVAVAAGRGFALGLEAGEAAGALTSELGPGAIAVGIVVAGVVAASAVAINLIFGHGSADKPSAPRFPPCSASSRDVSVSCSAIYAASRTIGLEVNDAAHATTIASHHIYDPEPDRTAVNALNATIIHLRTYIRDNTTRGHRRGLETRLAEAYGEVVGHAESWGKGMHAAHDKLVAMIRKAAGVGAAAAVGTALAELTRRQRDDCTDPAAGYKPFVKAFYRFNLCVRTDHSIPPDTNAHHIYPQKFEAAEDFGGRNVWDDMAINNQDPQRMCWMPSPDPHQSLSRAYNANWTGWLTGQALRHSDRRLHPTDRADAFLFADQQEANLWGNRCRFYTRQLTTAVG